MGDWMRDITAGDFLKWAIDNPSDFRDLFDDNDWLSDVEEAEANDFFGTEGFDKRYG